MLFQLRLRRDGFSVDAAIEKGRELPSWFLEAPEPEVQDQFYLQAFWELHTCRSFGFDLGPIPWRDIIRYGEYQRLDDDVLRLFVYIIRELDDAYLGFRADEARRQREALESDSKRRWKGRGRG